MTYVEILEECNKRTLVIAKYQHLIDNEFGNFKKALDIIHFMSERQGGITESDHAELEKLRIGVEQSKSIQREISGLLRTLRNAGE